MLIGTIASRISEKSFNQIDSIKNNQADLATLF